ncbi:reductive dehalogenase membrane anchor [Dehalogenimonas formicexedens]|uniref:Reductive dehalogenase membrane anchor n=1 Tax=Dehalogenimonas formicexedens TaxID=1839801 RepID=A0A1P8F8R6_9CHLR|nr:hypothetical protein [Dehalogenimonas formicexedens]APV44864.1 reductive dehalogenase membrane anchor [Dehalogenimonas formicexedens]
MFFVGMLITAVVAAFVIWAMKKGIKFTWYEWLLGALTILFALMTIQHYTGSLAEYQVTAAKLGGLMFGSITLVLLAVTVQFVWRHNKAVR